MNVASLNELFSLQGRVALVTGASGGIGSELARGLAIAGANVALSGRAADRLESVQRQITETGGSAAVIPAELAELQEIDPLVESVESQLGTIDILINCAGINQREPITDVQLDTYDRIMNLNLRTPYFLSRRVFTKMAQKGGGKIINIGSLTTGTGVGTLSVYGLSKSAVGQMTRVMAVEWAPFNVQVNCICPGWIETELTKPLWADERRRTWILDRVPAKRPGKPEDLVGIAVYLASNAANFTTGQTFYVDGGFTAGGQW